MFSEPELLQFRVRVFNKKISMGGKECSSLDKVTDGEVPQLEEVLAFGEEEWEDDPVLYPCFVFPLETLKGGPPYLP